MLLARTLIERLIILVMHGHAKRQDIWDIPLSHFQENVVDPRDHLFLARTIGQAE